VFVEFGNQFRWFRCVWTLKDLDYLRRYVKDPPIKVLPFNAQIIPTSLSQIHYRYLNSFNLSNKSSPFLTCLSSATLSG
jgi:hypothetical protein